MSLKSKKKTKKKDFDAGFEAFLKEVKYMYIIIKCLRRLS